MAEAGLAVAGDVGGVTALAQRALQELRRLTVVFDYEHTHGTRRRLLSSRSGVRTEVRTGVIPEKMRSEATCSAGTGRLAVVPYRHLARGCQLFFSWTATKRVWSPDLTRISTALRPSLVASLTPLATSSGLFTESAADLEDHVARLDALLGGVGGAVDVGDEHAVLVGAGAGRHRQPELIELGDPAAGPDRRACRSRPWPAPCRTGTCRA